ncbi:MAG: aminoglycoside 6-adenylyltransferase [Bacteroidota bacterium]|mgnify:FL=1
MRSSDEIKKIILDTANSDDRIRAVLLNGSRANNNVEPDPFQDFDIVYIVNQIDMFTADHTWTSIFGDKLIWQLPDEMSLCDSQKNETFSFHYLMLFKDGNRIDLSLFPTDKFESDFEIDSLTIVWLDKDNLFSNIELASDKDYLIKRPTDKLFNDTCNEFWWVSTYVAKALIREEITNAKAIMENEVRKMFMNIIEWYIGTNTNFSVSFGKGGKFMKKYLTPNEYNAILTTYSDFISKNIWTSLFIMTELFGEFATQVANKLNFNFNYTEQQSTLTYLHQLHNNQK